MVLVRSVLGWMRWKGESLLADGLCERVCFDAWHGPTDADSTHNADLSRGRPRS